MNSTELAGPAAESAPAAVDVSPEVDSLQVAEIDGNKEKKIEKLRKALKSDLVALKVELHQMLHQDLVSLVDQTSETRSLASDKAGNSTRTALSLDSAPSEGGTAKSLSDVLALNVGGVVRFSDDACSRANNILFDCVSFRVRSTQHKLGYNFFLRHQLDHLIRDVFVFLTLSVVGVFHDSVDTHQIPNEHAGSSLFWPLHRDARRSRPILH